jgi:hypothetical protein
MCGARTSVPTVGDRVVCAGGRVEELAMVAAAIRSQPGAATWLRDVVAARRLKSSYPLLAVTGLVLYFLLLIRTVAQTAAVD